MSPLVKALERFNRKERFWLLSDAVGREVPDNVTQRIDLNQRFTDKLEKELRTRNSNLTIPEGAWWAFDYHLDWLFAVLEFAPEKYKLNFRPRPNDGADPGDKYIRGTQEDCDLIIAFDSTIILVEAKVGESWSNAQLTRKMGRLKRLKSPENTKIYFVLASRDRPKHIKRDGWPDWAFKNKADQEPFWIPLELRESSKSWLKVTRCDNDKNWTSNADGEFWRLCGAGQ